MAAIHVLGRSGANTYTVVVHVAVPTGTNRAGVGWNTALKNSRKQSASVMAIGTGPGQITSAEAASVVNGDVIESVMAWGADPNWTDQQLIDDLTLRSTQLQTELLAAYSADLKFFGYTQG